MGKLILKNFYLNIRNYTKDTPAEFTCWWRMSGPSDLWQCRSSVVKMSRHLPAYQFESGCQVLLQAYLQKEYDKGGVGFEAEVLTLARVC